MGRRQIRLRRFQLQPENLHPLVGMRVDVILRDKTSWLGVLRQATEQALELEDLNFQPLNRRNHRHTFPLAEVDEVIATYVAPY